MPNKSKALFVLYNRTALAVLSIFTLAADIFLAYFSCVGNALESESELLITSSNLFVVLLATSLFYVNFARVAKDATATVMPLRREEIQLAPLKTTMLITGVMFAAYCIAAAAAAQNAAMTICCISSALVFYPIICLRYFAINKKSHTVKDMLSTKFIKTIFSQVIFAFVASSIFSILPSVLYDVAGGIRRSMLFLTVAVIAAGAMIYAMTRIYTFVKNC